MTSIDQAVQLAGYIVENDTAALGSPELHQLRDEVREAVLEDFVLPLQTGHEKLETVWVDRAGSLDQSDQRLVSLQPGEDSTAGQTGGETVSLSQSTLLLHLAPLPPCLGLLAHNSAVTFQTVGYFLMLVNSSGVSCRPVSS